MNVAREIQKINEKEIDLLVQRGDFSGSWHDDYKDSAYIYIGGLPYGLTEGDIIAIFSQYGEVVDINLARDKETGKSKGFCFLAYLDQRSTHLAVDNLNLIEIADRTIRVDHVRDYKPPKRKNKDGEEIIELSYNAAPKPLEELPEKEQSIEKYEEEPDHLDKETQMIEYGIDPDDPMAEYLLKKALKKQTKKEKKIKKEKKKDNLKDNINNYDRYKDKNDYNYDKQRRYKNDKKDYERERSYLDENYKNDKKEREYQRREEKDSPKDRRYRDEDDKRINRENRYQEEKYRDSTRERRNRDNDLDFDQNKDYKEDRKGINKRKNSNNDEDKEYLRERKYRDERDKNYNKEKRYYDEKELNSPKERRYLNEKR